MNDLTILADELLPGDYLVLKAKAIQVADVIYDADEILVILSDAEELLFAYGEQIRILDDSPADETVKSSSHKNRDDF